MDYAASTRNVSEQLDADVWHTDSSILTRFMNDYDLFVKLLVVSVPDRLSTLRINARNMPWERNR